ncbi:MAG: LysR family transcriptional regulator [Gammaproteobacteria bacterium]|nr:MAG: LysR family transcriptional regulator [Gammaproteobacteria bacterium]
MNITFRQLRVFLKVCESGSYTRAAEKLFMTQPAVSMQIKKLEEQVEIALFEKRDGKMILTEAGRTIRQHAQAILHYLDEGVAAVNALKGLERGSLAISVASTVNYFAPKLIAAFNRQFQGISMTLDVVNREHLLQQLDANEQDIYLMGKPPEGKPYLSEAFMLNPLVVIAAPDHPLLDQKKVSLERLTRETFVVREEGSGTRIAMERHFQSLGAELREGMVMNTNEAIKQAVQAGLGLGIVSLHTLEMELESGRLSIVSAEGFPIQRHWYIVHHENKRLTPAAQAFKQFVLEQASSLASAKNS